MENEDTLCPDAEALRLDRQLCFPLYAASRAVIRQYHPFLSALDLTYTQYIAMMVLWERKQTNVKELGECLYLDSGTLTPLLKKMEQKGYIERKRSESDERNLIISITKQGEQLREEALRVPSTIGQCVKLEPEEAKALYDILYKILRGL